MPPLPVFILLGRIGDLLNALPGLHELHAQSGQTVSLLVAQEFAPHVTGFPWLEVLIWPGERNHLQVEAATVAVRRHYADNVKNLQLYVPGGVMPMLCESFVRHGHRLIGPPSPWGLHPLPFPPTSPQEASWVSGYALPAKPILFAGAGHSSPFPQESALLSELNRRFPGRVVDISKFRAPRYWWMRGLFEQAQCLVSTDTAALHLARLTGTPTVALVASTPTRWHGTAWSPNMLDRIRYADFASSDTSPQAFERVCMACRGFGDTRRIVHVFAEHDMQNRRNVRAAQTWEVEDKFSGRWTHLPVPLGARDGRSVGDPKPVHFLRDVIEAGVAKAGPSDIVCLSNTDIKFVPGLTGRILEGTRKVGCLSAHRMDHPFGHEPSRVNDPGDVYGLTYCPGTDLYAFEKSWWTKHGDKVPDFLLGREAWDLTFEHLSMQTGGGEIRYGIWHEYHESDWFRGGVKETLPGNRHNLALARGWFAKYHPQFLATEPHLRPRNLFSDREHLPRF